MAFRYPIISKKGHLVSVFSLFIIPSLKFGCFEELNQKFIRFFFFLLKFLCFFVVFL